MASLTVFLASAAQEVQAFSSRVLSVEEMTGDADLVVRVQISDSYVAQRADLLVTIFDLQILEVLKGYAVDFDFVDVEVPGGSRDGLVQHVAGAPVLKNGEYIFFLQEGPVSGEPLSIMGWQAYRLSRDSEDPENGKRYVVREFSRTARGTVERDYQALSVDREDIVEDYDRFATRVFEAQY